MTNAEIARIMREIAVYLDMDGVAFKPRAYEKVAEAIDAVGEPIGDIYRRGGIKAVEQIPGVGKSIAEKIVVLIETGSLPYHQEFRQRIPVDIAGLTAIEGVGPKMIKLLYDELGVRTVDDLERAARTGRVRGLPRCGERTEQKILKCIGFLQQGRGRFLLGDVLPLVTTIERRLAALREVKQVAVAGSIRRRKETVGDADLLVVSTRPERVMDFFVALPEVMHVHGKGLTKSSVKLHTGMDVDLRIVPASSFGAALSYFTGSKDHNVALRRLAIERQLKLNEYGVFRGERAIAGRTEEEVYAALGLPYIAPELREMTGEIAAAQAGTLPALVGYDALRGDLQTQTNWTDGKHTIEEMAAAAQRLGLEYIAITDHTRSLAMTGGSDEPKLRRQMAAIDALNKRLRGITVLKGAEVNIDKNGGLDIADELLAQLDIVGAAIHSHFTLDRAAMTRRVLRAIEHPCVDVLFHPTARKLQQREPCDFDIDAVIAAAKRTGTLLEIDAYPDRLDLRDEHVRKAVGAGVRLVIDSDAHNVHHFEHLHFGIAVARRGWAESRDVVNTLPLPKFFACLKRNRTGRRPRKAR